MDQKELKGEKGGYCLAGAYRYEDEAVAERALTLLRRWSA
jgi:hypothetical protein